MWPCLLSLLDGLWMSSKGHAGDAVPGSVAEAVLLYDSALTCKASVDCRFYDPTAGDIQIGEHEIRDVTMSSLRSKFGAVPQVCYIPMLQSQLPHVARDPCMHHTYLISS